MGKMTTENRDCMLCEQKKPISGAYVLNENGVVVGVVCGSHTLKEVILTKKNGKDFLSVNIELVSEEVEEDD